MIHWLSGVAFILYLSLLVTPQIAAAHAPHLTPIADSQLQAISPPASQLSLSSEQDIGDDNDNGLPPSASTNPLFQYQVDCSLPAAIVLPRPKGAHLVRAPPLYSLA